MNRIIIGAVVILILLVFFTLLVTSFTNNKNQQQTAGITPIPTQILSGRSGPLEDDTFIKNVNDDHFAFSDDEESKLSAFNDTLPYFSNNLEIEYSDELGLYFVQKKTPEADQELDELFKSNGLEQVVQDRSGLFINTTEPPTVAITKAQDEIAVFQEQTSDPDSPDAVEPLRGDEQQFVDTVKTLSDFKLNVEPSPAGKSSTGGGTCATGGYPFATRGQQLIGGPGVGTHSWTASPNNWQSDNAQDFRTPVGTPLCAIAAGTIGRVKMSSSAASSRYAGISVYLDVGGRQWWYAHLSSVAPGIGPGVRVAAGQIIGYSGSANGVPHLHLGVNNGNPRTLLGL